MNWHNECKFRYLADQLKESSSKQADCSPILFMIPSAAFMVSMCETAEMVEECLNQLALSKRKLVFIPVNNADNPEIVGAGSHWSLLVFHRASNAFFYLDSIRSITNNEQSA